MKNDFKIGDKVRYQGDSTIYTIKSFVSGETGKEYGGGNVKKSKDKPTPKYAINKEFGGMMLLSRCKKI